MKWVLIKSLKLFAWLLLGTQWVWASAISLAQAEAAQPPVGAAAEAADEHPLWPAIRFAETSLEAVGQLEDYTARLTKRELINGQLQTQVMLLKLRQSPFSVYLKYGEPHAGREILFVAGRNQNQLLAHETQGLAALAGTVALPLNSPRVMAENRHPITDLGLKRMLELVIEQWKAETEFGECEVRYFPDARLGDLVCHVIESSHPRPRRQFRYHTTRLYIDKQTMFPIRVENFGFPAQPGQQPPLVEEYTYLDLRPNVGLADRDFDQRNPNYQFR